MFVIAMLPALILSSDIANLGFRNFASREFEPEEVEVLGLSLGFAPTPFSSPTQDLAKTATSFDSFARSIYLSDYFSSKSQKKDDGTPARFRIPKPGFHPRSVEGWKPAEGIAEYHEATFASVSDAILNERGPHVPNLSWSHRKFLAKLRNDDSIVIGACDKNLGLFADDAANYERRGLENLQKTHARAQFTEKHAIILTLAAIRARLFPMLPSLPKWAATWIKSLVTSGCHPATHAVFSVAAFRLLYKVHKAELGVRPITGNHTWVTQPLALLVAFLLLVVSYCKATATYVRDADQFQRDLGGVVVGTHHLLVTYDAVNLYPSIPHEDCCDKIRDHLLRGGCEYVNFIFVALRLILEFNFCMYVLLHSLADKMCFTGRIYIASWMGATYGETIAFPINKGLGT
jgi:hypothetical protein